ncbi:hypothetical protein FPOAC2_01233 [Fusarium poae]
MSNKHVLNRIENQNGDPCDSEESDGDHQRHPTYAFQDDKGKWWFWPSTIVALKRRKLIMDWYSRDTSVQPIWGDSGVTFAYLAAISISNDFDQLTVCTTGEDANAQGAQESIDYDKEFFNVPMDPRIATTDDKEAFERTKSNRRLIVEHRQLALENNWDKIASSTNFRLPQDDHVGGRYRAVAMGQDVVLLHPQDKDVEERRTLWVSDAGYAEYRARVNLLTSKDVDGKGFYLFPSDIEVQEQDNAFLRGADISPLMGVADQLAATQIDPKKIRWFASGAIFEAFRRVNEQCKSSGFHLDKAYRTGEPDLDQIIQSYWDGQYILSMAGQTSPYDGNQQEDIEWTELAPKPQRVDSDDSEIKRQDVPEPGQEVSTKETMENWDPNDFGVSDIRSWLQELATRHPGEKVPKEDEWAKIRTTTAKEDWTMNMVIEAVFRDFEKDGVPVSAPERRIFYETAQTTLLRDVISCVKTYFREISNGTDAVQTTLIQSTRRAATEARAAYLRDEPPYKVTRLLPAHAKVLACGFIYPRGNFDGVIAGALAGCQKAHLMNIKNDRDSAMPALQGTIASTNKLEEARKKDHSDILQMQEKMQEKMRDMERRLKNTEYGFSNLEKKSHIKLKAGQLANKSINMEHLSNDIADRLNAEHVKEKSIQLKHLSAEVIRKLERDSSSHQSDGHHRPSMTTPVPETPSFTDKHQKPVAASSGTPTPESRKRRRQVAILPSAAQAELMKQQIPGTSPNTPTQESKKQQIPVGISPSTPNPESRKRRRQVAIVPSTAKAELPK